MVCSGGDIIVDKNRPGEEDPPVTIDWGMNESPMYC